MEVVGKDAPGVGLDFEMGAGFGMFLEIGKGGFRMIQCRGKGGEGFRIEWNVEVTACFARNGEW